MRSNSFPASGMEKIISILSYFSMGIFGLIFLIIAYFFKKKIKFFLMYNIAQSMIISIFLALFNLVLKIFLQIINLIPFLKKFSIYILNKTSLFGLSFNKIEIIIFILLIYISIGILAGKIFFVPFLTKIMKTVMHSYR